MDSVIEALSLKKLHSLKCQIEDLKQKISDSKKNKRAFVSEQELLISRVSSQVINFFIDDVVSSFEEFIAHNVDGVNALRAHFKETACVNIQIIRFSEEGKILNDYLETIVAKQVINSPEVAAFDDKAKRVVSSLFDFYYDNPRLLHDGTLERIFIEMRKRTPNVIHFQDSDIDLVNDEWKRIKKPKDAGRLRDIRELFPDVDFSAYKTVEEFKETLSDNSNDYNVVSRYLDSCFCEYEEKKRILVRSICDFISGMTDTYALTEYRRLMY